MSDCERVAITEFVLREFRLHAASGADEVARIVARFPDGIEPAVPLLQNIDDHRDVAIVGALHGGERLAEREQRAALDPLVESWQPVKRYGPRITESATDPPLSYRLAVTESGMNDPGGEPIDASPTARQAGVATPIGLVWVGEPLGTHGGLMVLLGSYDEEHAHAGAREWPLALSRQLHVRIYETRR